MSIRLMASLILKFDPKPVASSRRYIMELFSTRTRPSLGESPFIKGGDGKEGRSAYSELLVINDRILTWYEITDLSNLVYLAPLKYM